MYKDRQKYLKRLQEDRLKEISHRYKESKDKIYLQFLEENNMGNFMKKDNPHEKHPSIHGVLIPKINENSIMYEPIQVIKKGSIIDDGQYKRLSEKSIAEVLEEKRDYQSYDPVASKINKMIKK